MPTFYKVIGIAGVFGLLCWAIVLYGNARYDSGVANQKAQTAQAETDALQKWAVKRDELDTLGKKWTDDLKAFSSDKSVASPSLAAAANSVWGVPAPQHKPNPLPDTARGHTDP